MPRTPHPTRTAATAMAVIVFVLAFPTFVDMAGAQTSAINSGSQAENPNSTAAGLVFFGVCAVIIVGALVLYLRNRQAQRRRRRRR